MISRDFDLNLLKVLVALLQQKNTYRAAEVLDTSQPSVSRSLAKLRVLLNDQLFIRSKQGFKLTPRAEALAQSLPSMYSALLDTFETSVFVAENYEGSIKIAMNAYIADIYGAKIFKHLSDLMPKLSIELLSWNERSSHLILADQVDIALSFLPMTLPKNIIEKKVGELEFGFIANKNHFPNLAEITPSELAKCTLSTVLIPEYNSQQFKFNKLSNKEFKINVALTSHHITPLLDLTQNTDTLFVAPQKLFEKIDNINFSFIKLADLDSINSIADIGMMFNAKYRNSPVYNWFELQIMACILK
ncbi:LysR family transcriptional regulator [Colwelliaceae bacterium BS250]